METNEQQPGKDQFHSVPNLSTAPRGNSRQQLRDAPTPQSALPIPHSAIKSPHSAELRLLLEGVFERYGYDFRDYAPGSLLRRVRARVADEGVPSIAALRDLVLRDPVAFGRFLTGLTVHVTAMFRDPAFFHAVREEVVPHLRTWPFLRVWVAGCATGEEVYSLAIVLREEGLAGRVRIYATDLSDATVAQARAGVFRLANMRDYTANYQAAGGRHDFSRYYIADHDHALLSPALREQITFARHNLVTDASFNEFHLICCRNVLIYFNPGLQTRVHKVFSESLARFGFLAMGSAESLRFTSHEEDYEVFNAEQRIYRRKA